MPQFLLTTPDGKKYKVTGPDAQSAYNAFQQYTGGGQPAPVIGQTKGGVEPPPVPKLAPNDPEYPKSADYWGSGRQGLDYVTMGLSTKLNAAGGALLDSLFDAARGKEWDYSDRYNKNLDWQRANQEMYNDQNPIRSAAGTAGGLALGITNLPMLGSGLSGAMRTGSAYGLIGGAGSDADTLTERAGNAVAGGLTGGLIGGAGFGAGKLLSKGLEKGGEVLNVMRAPPEVKAISQAYKIADEVYGPNNAMMMSKRLAELGPDAINADVLGTRGLALGRGAANISPEARETLASTVQARKGNQNPRLAADIERAAGLPVGNTKNVETLKREAYDAVRPQINAAYRAARLAGQDVPLDAFDNIITTPVGNRAFKQALDNITSRAARDPSAGGNLAVLDETKRLLDGYATEAFRKGDPMGSEYAATAKALRETLDSFLATGQEYATARGLRQQAYKMDEAFDLGEQLGGSRVPLGLPQQVTKMDPKLRPNVARAYGAKKVESLLNKPSTEGAMNELLTPQGRQASKAALGKRDALLGKALEREKTFNVTNRELVGNSTTARQLAEMAGTGIGTTGVGMLLGYDPTTSGAAGLLAAVGRKAIPTITRKMVTENQRAVAPFIAEILTANGMPINRAIPVNQLANLLQRVATNGDAKLAKTMALIWNNQVQDNNARTTP